MLSIYDVVFEKANFKNAFGSVIDKLKMQELDKSSPKLPDDINYNRHVLYDEICIRVALRMMHLYENHSEVAYGDLLYNAIQMDEEEQAEELLKKISINDDSASISALLKLTALYAKYDKGYFSGILNPDINDIPIYCVNFTRFIILQIQKFVKEYNSIPFSECQFDGAYNNIISMGYCGMPTYLIKDTIWVFNTYHGEKWGVILLLIVYVMGMHSKINAYKNVSHLGIFNICEGNVKTVSIREISNITFSAICKNYIGYNTPRAANAWLFASGDNQNRIESAIQYHKNHMTELALSKLNPELFEDGIHKISYSEYWSYYENRVDPYATMPTKPAHIEAIYMIKSKEYLMFIAKGKQTLYILQGGKFVTLNCDEINYYYAHLNDYGDKICKMFSKYWDALDMVSDFVKKLKVPSLFIKSGKIHGCIVDIDFYNHIYLNPYDGKITPYYAPSRNSRKPYTNLASLIAEQKPECMKQFEILCENDKYKLLTSKYAKMINAALTSSEVKICKQISFEQGIYDISRLMKLFQKVREAKLICFWTDAILINSDKLIETN